METATDKVIEIKTDSIQTIVIGQGVEVEGHQLVSKKLLEIINHLLTANPMIVDAFKVEPDCIRKIRFLPTYAELGKEHELKFGLFNPETKEVAINLQGHFDSAKSSVKEGGNLELMCIRAHLWFSMLTSIWHEFLHAVSFAIDPEGTMGEDKDELEEMMAEEAQLELAMFIRDFKCEPPAMADEPFYGTRFMEFFIKEVKDNAEAWALAQNSIHQYNERNNTHVLWKDGDMTVSSFRKWFRVAYKHDWDNKPEPLAELKFSLSIPTTTALEAPESISDEQLMEEEMERKATKHDESPFQAGGVDPGETDRAGLVQAEVLKKEAGVPKVLLDTIELPASELPNVEKEVNTAIDKLSEPAPVDEATAVLAERGKKLTDDDIHEVAVDIIEEAGHGELAGEILSSLYDRKETPDVQADLEAIAFQNAGDDDPGDLPDEQEALQPGLPDFPSPTPEVAAPAAPPATAAIGTPLPTATSQPTFTPETAPAGAYPKAPTPDPADYTPQNAGFNRQTLRTGLPNHNFTAEQMREMCGQVFLRCVNHIFTKCGWTPGGNPPFVPELRGAITEPISVSGIPGIENFLIGMDIIDPTSGTYVINSPASAHAGMIKGKVTQKQHLPSYMLYFNYNGIEIKRFIAPQNQWKTNASGYSAPAQRAQAGAQIAWIMDGDDNTSNKWRAKIENGVIEWLV